MNKRLLPLVFGVAACTIATCAVFAQTGGVTPGDRFERAQRFLSVRLKPTILNGQVVPHWIGSTDQFWYARQTPSGSKYVTVDASTAKEIAIADSAPSSDADAGGMEVPSPNGKAAVFVRDNNLWLRDRVNSTERQITRDGIEAFAYGNLAYADLFRVLRRRTQTTQAPEGILWSPDSRYIVAMRADLRKVPLRPVVVEYAPKDSSFAVAHLDRYPIAADAEMPPRSIVVIDTQNGATIDAHSDPNLLQDYAPAYFGMGVVWWKLIDHELYFITGTRDATRYGLAALDLRSGNVRTVIEETEQHFYSLNPEDYSRPNVHLLSKRPEAIWYSQRTGYGHLYLYDTRTGTVERAITHGDWVVFDLLRVDEDRRIAWFTAGGRERGRNPYYRHLYRVSLDGGEPTLLTPEDADHQFSGHFGLFARLYGPSQSQISPSGRYVVDSFSTVSQPPITLIRSTQTGKLVGRVIDSDVSGLMATGWRPPQRFVAKAADGKTDLHGVMYLPTDFDAQRRYALIERTYPGPQVSWSPQSFMDNIASLGSDMQALAELGFIVIELDGRGTTHRSRDFRYAFTGTEDVLGAADHKAAIEQLAKEHPWIDPGRIGITGASFGGYGSLRAMLLYPEFFKVCVSMVGPADYRSLGLALTNDRFFGYPARSKENAGFEELISNTRLVGRLRDDNKLYLMAGGIDENVPLAQAFTMFEALIGANKRFDSLILPNVTHGVQQNPYAIQRMMEYFAEHLGAPN
jgi:dipeptidyl-peptidase 4